MLPALIHLYKSTHTYINFLFLLFLLLQVEDKLVKKFNLVAGYVPVLKQYKEDVSRCTTTSCGGVCVEVSCKPFLPHL